MVKSKLLSGLEGSGIFELGLAQTGTEVEILSWSQLHPFVQNGNHCVKCVPISTNFDQCCPLLPQCGHIFTNPISFFPPYLNKNTHVLAEQVGLSLGWITSSSRIDSGSKEVRVQAGLGLGLTLHFMDQYTLDGRPRQF